MFRIIAKIISKRVRELENELSLLVNDYRRLEEEYKRYREEKEKKADRKKAVFLTNDEVKEVEKEILLCSLVDGYITYKKLKEIAKNWGVSFRTAQRIAKGEHKYSSPMFRVNVLKVKRVEK